VDLQVDLQLRVLIDYRRFGIHENPSGQSVDDHQVAVANLFAGVRHMHQHRDAQGACKDRGVRGQSAFLDDQCPHASAFQLRNNGRQQIAGDNYASIRKCRRNRRSTLGQLVEQTPAHIMQIACSLTEVRVFEAGEEGTQLFYRFVHGRLDIHALFQA
jgi:hypothetical protein